MYLRYMRLLFLFLTLTAFTLAHAQKVIDITKNDPNVVGQEQILGMVGGQIFNTYKYVKIKEGTPYFIDDWSKGAVMPEGGRLIGGLEVKLNLLDNEVHYKGPKGEELIASVPISEVVLGDSSTGNRHVFVNGSKLAGTDKNLAHAWLEVLVNDQVSLLRQIRKKILEGASYATSTVEQSVITTDLYYLQMDGKLVKINSWSDLPGMFPGKKEQIVQYIKSNNLRGKAAADYTQVVGYYNKLKGAAREI